MKAKASTWAIIFLAESKESGAYHSIKFPRTDIKRQEK
jgi:hypothetical protein